MAVTPSCAAGACSCSPLPGGERSRPSSSPLPGGARGGGGGGVLSALGPLRAGGGDGSRGGRRLREGGRLEAERDLKEPALLLDQEVDGAVGGLLPLEELAVELGALVLHAVQGGHALAGQVQGLGQGLGRGGAPG